MTITDSPACNGLSSPTRSAGLVSALTTPGKKVFIDRLVRQVVCAMGICPRRSKAERKMHDQVALGAAIQICEAAWIGYPDESIEPVLRKTLRGHYATGPTVSLDLLQPQVEERLLGVPLINGKRGQFPSREIAFVLRSILKRVYEEMAKGRRGVRIARTTSCATGRGGLTRGSRAGKWARTSSP